MANQPSTIDGMFSESCVCFFLIFLHSSCSPYLGKWSKWMNIYIYIEHTIYLFVKWVLFDHQLQINPSGAMLFRSSLNRCRCLGQSRDCPGEAVGRWRICCLLFALALGIVKQLFAGKTCKFIVFFWWVLELPVPPKSLFSMMFILLMVQKSCDHQLRLVVEIPSFTTGFIHPNGGVLAG